MRLGEECPYITPCGWCSRKEAPCDNKPRRKKIDYGRVRIPPPPKLKEEKRAEAAPPQNEHPGKVAVED